MDAVTPPDSNRHEVQAALTTDARKTNGQVGRFFLSGGERKRIPLTALDIRRPGVLGDVILDTTSGQIRLTYPGAHLLEISANAEVGKPERRILKVDLDSDGRAKIEWKR